MERRDAERVVTTTECLGFIGSQAVAFVEDHNPWNLFQVKLGQDRLDRLDLSLDIPGACVHEM